MVLMSDLSEKPIKDIRIGDIVVGLAEKQNGHKEHVESIVLNKWNIIKDAYRITLKDGTELICSGDHRWYTNRGWKFTSGDMSGKNRRPYLTTNNYIMKLYDIGHFNAIETNDFKKGYLCGMIRGDGLLRCYDYSNKKRTQEVNGVIYTRKKDIQYHFRLAVRDVECLLRTKQYLRFFGVYTSRPYKFADNIMAIRTHKKSNFDKIHELIKFKETSDFYRGFVSGFYDAEGNVNTSTKTSMSVSNKDKRLIEFYKKCLLHHDFQFVQELQKDRNIYLIKLKGSRSERIRFIQFFNLSILKMRKNVFKGTMKNLKSKIANIESLHKKINMVDIETSTENFIANGCISHNCYAKKMAIRFNRKTEENWKDMVLNRKAVNKSYRKREGRIMCFSSHDITLESLGYSIFVLRELLKAKNEILITSKPNPYCILELVTQLENFKEQIQFRFTITSRNDNLLRFWEPNAPSFQERKIALEVAWAHDFKTSVSIEPYLDEDPSLLISWLFPHITESIWVGKMNYIKANNIAPEDQKFYDHQRKITSFKHIQKIVSDLKNLPEKIKTKIRLKDSIRTIYKNKGLEVTI